MKTRFRDQRSAADTQPRPRQSTNVTLGLLVLVAGTVAGCGSSEPRRCTDKDGRIVEDGRCGISGAPYGAGYRWYYGGRGLALGETVSGGSYTPKPGTSYHSSTSRGGFGRSAGVHGSGSS